MLKTLRHPVRFLDGIVDRVFTVLGAVTLSQFPQFYGQYMQRLGGTWTRQGDPSISMCRQLQV